MELDLYLTYFKTFKASDFFRVKHFGQARERLSQFRLSVVHDSRAFETVKYIVKLFVTC